jgi:hypothetical protein
MTNEQAKLYGWKPKWIDVTTHRDDTPQVIQYGFIKPLWPPAWLNWK